LPRAWIAREPRICARPSSARWISCGRRPGAAGARFVVALLPSKEEIYGAEAFPAVLRPVADVKAEL
jgi:hypothetical protein